MAAQTLTNVSINYDDASISGLLNGETVTLNNSTLTIDSDVRWAQQAAVFGSMTISPTLGGKVTIDGSKVKWVRFDASSGVVPALGVVNVMNVTGSIAGQGEFLGIWTALGTAPLAAGVALPATGYIKLRQSPTAFVDNEVMTLSNGSTLTVDGAPETGWIHVVGAEAGTMNVPRLGEFHTAGSWFYLGTTNGSDDQTFQFPVTDNCPAIQVETAPGSGVYEWWLNAGARWGTATQLVSTDLRGKYFGEVNSTGVITIARRASNPCGYKPVTGLKVRIPNVILSSSNATNWSLNTISATASTRYDFITTSAGAIDINHVSSNWYPSFASPYSVSFKDSAQLLVISIANTASTTVISNVGIGLNDVMDIQPLVFSNLFSGLTLSNIRAARYASTATNNTIFGLTDCTNPLIENCSAETFGNATTEDRGVTTCYGYALTRCVDVELHNNISICGQYIFGTCTNVNMLGCKFADKLCGSTTATAGLYAVSINASCNNIKIDGFSSPFPEIANIHPYVGMFTVLNSNNIKLYNVGTALSPFSLGSANLTGLGINATVVSNLEMRRLYFTNPRTSVLALTNTVQKVVCDNVWGDGTQAQSTRALDMISRGIRYSQSTAGQVACYGFHWDEGFRTDTMGRLTCYANEPLPSTVNQVTITSGTPKFNSNGLIQMATAGDQVMWELPYYAIGHTKLGGWNFTNAQGTSLPNVHFEYTKDTGSGFEAWKHLMSVRTRSSGGALGANTFIYAAATGGRDPQIGDYVSSLAGTNFSEGTTITNIVGNTITLSDVILVALTTNQPIIFTKDIMTETSFSPVTGFKLRVRATAQTTLATTAVQTIQVATTTNAVDQRLQYPLPVVLNTAEIVNIVPGSRLRVYNMTTNAEIANEVVVGSSWEFLYQEGTSFSDGDIVEIRLANVDGATAYLPFTLTTICSEFGWSALMHQQLDDVYITNAIDGSTVTELIGDYPNVQIDSNDADGETTVQRIYAWFVYNQSTTMGIRNFFNGILAEDELNYKIKTSTVNIKMDNITNIPLMVIGGRIYSDNGSTVIAATSNSIQMDPKRVYGIETGTSGLTPQESEKLDKAAEALTTAKFMALK